MFTLVWSTSVIARKLWLINMWTNVNFFHCRWRRLRFGLPKYRTLLQTHKSTLYRPLLLSALFFFFVTLFQFTSCATVLGGKLLSSVWRTLTDWTEQNSLLRLWNISCSYCPESNIRTIVSAAVFGAKNEYYPMPDSEKQKVILELRSTPSSGKFSTSRYRLWRHTLCSSTKTRAYFWRHCSQLGDWKRIVGTCYYEETLSLVEGLHTPWTIFLHKKSCPCQPRQKWALPVSRLLCMFRLVPSRWVNWKQPKWHGKSWLPPRITIPSKLVTRSPWHPGRLRDFSYKRFAAIY